MIWNTILTIIICFLLFALYSEYGARCRVEKKCEDLRAEIRDLRVKNSRYHDWEIKRLCHDNYNRGLDDGCKCDTLYKNILAKYKAGEQITVMMYGEDPEKGGEKS